MNSPESFNWPGDKIRFFYSRQTTPNMYKYLAFALLIVSTLALPTDKSEPDKLDCFQYEDDIFTCMAVKVVSSLDRAAKSTDLKIIDGITFVRDMPIQRNGKSLKPQTELLKELPRDASDRTLQLATMLFESAVSFFKSHSLKVNIPEGSMSRTLVEGRAKIKKVILPLIAAAGIKIFALVPILLGGLALLIVKALFVGKVALIIAGILAFQRLFSGSTGTIGSGFGGISSNIFNKNPQGSWHDGNQGWSATSANQGQGYYRSFNDNVDTHSLVYSAQVPSSNEAN